MLKITLLLLFVNYLFSATVKPITFFSITCPGGNTYSTTGNIASDLLHLTSEIEPNYWWTRSGEFIDSSFVGCGGSSLKMRIVGVERGTYGGGMILSSRTLEQNDIWTKNTEGKLTNKVIMVNGYPCLSYPRNEVTNFLIIEGKGVADGSWNLLSKYGDYVRTEAGYDLDPSADSSLLKDMCAPIEENPEIDYTPYLNKIIDNTSPISGILDSVNNFFSLETAKESNLSDLGNNFDFNQSDEAVSSAVDGFNDDIKSYATSSFEDNKKIITLSSCSAPAPIKATVLNKSYTFFDIAMLTNDNVELIRNIFLLAGYLAGFVVVFRTI